MKVIVAEVYDFEFPLKVAVQGVPDGNPFSVKVTEYVPGVDALYVMLTGAVVGTLTDPEGDEATYWMPVPPEIGVRTLHEMLPDGSWTVIMFPVVEVVVPPTVTLHVVPDGRPLSTNVNVYAMLTAIVWAPSVSPE